MFLWVPSCISTWWSMICVGRRYSRFLEGKDIRRIDLSGNVDWLPDRGNGKCSRETHAHLLGALGGLVW